MRKGSIWSRLLVRNSQPHKIEELMGVEYQKRINKREDSKFVLVACMPKSGSTFLSRTLASILGFGYKTLVSAFSQIEHDLYEPKLIDNYGKGMVVHMHTRGADANLELARKYDMPVIVTTRNIADIVVSFHDHIHKETLKWPMAHLNEVQLAQLSTSKQYDLIIDFLVPWLISFFVSWTDATRIGGLPIKWIRYEELTLQQNKTFENLQNWLPYEPATNVLPSLVEKDPKSVRLNRGISGRGKQLLSKPQLDRIAHFATYYPGYDFSSIGLHPQDITHDSDD